MRARNYINNKNKYLAIFKRLARDLTVVAAGRLCGRKAKLLIYRRLAVGVARQRDLCAARAVGEALKDSNRGQKKGPGTGPKEEDSFRSEHYKIGSAAAERAASSRATPTLFHAEITQGLQEEASLCAPRERHTVLCAAMGQLWKPIR